ncbi:MAG: acetylglutamate kinase [Phycisphaerae bacterium]|nr:acetylglutamate kinase [Gemmatimonadaceae bacterium]
MSISQRGAITVVKLGGRTQGDPELPAALAALWQRTGGRLVIVHGGGDQISSLQRMRGEEPEFINGRRVSSPLVLELVRMVLSGAANKQLVSALTAAGAPAVGISGEDAAMLPAVPLDAERFGSSGTPGAFRPSLVLHLLDGGYLPVVSPVAVNSDLHAHGALNVNGDDAAASIAIGLGAEELMLMIDVEGMLDAQKQLIPALNLTEANALVATGVAGGGMAAKIEACAMALAGRVGRVRIGNLVALSRADGGTLVTP